MRRHAFQHKIIRLMLGTLMGSALAFGFSSQALALKDTLDRPAYMAPKAAEAFMFAVATRGKTALAVGARGIILRASTDNLKQWTQSEAPVSVNLTNLRFVTDQLVFVVGHDGVVLKSVDAGQTWTKVFDGNQANDQIIAQAEANLKSAAPGKDQKEAKYALEDAKAGAQFGPSRPLLDVWFKDENTGWVVGSYGQIFETQDSGQHWELISQRLNNPELKHYNGMDASQDGLMLLAGEGGMVYVSTDSGQSWQSLASGYTGHFYGTVIENDSPAHYSFLAYGFGGTLYHYDNDSNTWTALPKPSKESLVKALPEDNGKVLLLDQRGRIFELNEQTNALKKLRGDTGEAATDMVRVGNTGNQYLISTRHGVKLWSGPATSGQTK